MYAAIHNVLVGRNEYTPGEIIAEKLSKEQVAWLLSQGAIRDEGKPGKPGKPEPMQPELDKEPELPTEEEAADELPTEEEAAEAELMKSLMGDLVKGGK